jgi:hypothetical protein
MLPDGSPRIIVAEPSLISLYVAPPVAQLRVAAPPGAILEGDTLNDAVGIEPVGAGGVDMTGIVTVVVAVLLP